MAIIGRHVLISSKLRTAIACLTFTTLFSLACSEAKAVGGKTDAPALRSIAFEHSLNGDQDAALDYYQKAIDSATKEYGADSSYIAQLYYEMGTLALESKKFTHAEGYLRQAVQHNPNSVMSRVKYAECLQIKGKPDEALTQIRAALVKHSNSPEAREALVSWLNANKKTANAIHESFNLSVAARGNAAPVPAAMLAAAAAKKEELIASAPVPSPAPVVVPKNSPLKTFAWTDSKKKQEAEQKKAEEEKKTAEARKKAEEEEKKVAEELKKENAKKQQEKKAKQEKSKDKSKKDKSKKGAKGKPAAPAEMMAQEQPALRTTANRIKPKKVEGEVPSITMAPAVPQPMLVGNQGKPRVKTMVPPPPPTIPSFAFPGFSGGGIPPVPSQFSKPPKAAVAKKPKPAPAPKEEAAEKSAASSSAGNEENPEFLLDWAGANAKKKGK